MTTIGRRFEVESVAREGGMGTVYRARDLQTAGTLVALKVVRGPFANARFEREALLLAQIEGDGIVRYVSHGRIDADSMFLAMEWLEGQALDTRIERGPLTIGESLALGRRLARALGVAHARGVVHRDVKPSNVILRGGNAAEATLVDFGIARADSAWRAMTATGAVLGTPAYMAPEQARGERTVDARADIFSLGCVLFECLSGRPAFVGAHVVAVLAKILLDPAGRVSALRQDVPAVLDDLVASMLEKNPAARPADGAAVAAALDAILGGDVPVHHAVHHAPRAPAIGSTERRLATVILARAARASHDDAFADTEDARHGVTGEMQIIEVAASLGVSVTALANGTLVGAVVAEAGASDAAERAVRCALALRADLAGATIAIATGRAVVATHLPVGEAIDAAAILLERHSVAGGIWIDDATASMVDSRFVLERGHRGVSVAAERAAAQRVRTVLGRETPCVGRDRELALFETTFRECVEEPTARALVVIAAPGVGKTRLRRELATRVAAWESPPALWLGLADPIMQGASYALIGDLLRRVLDLRQCDSLEQRRENLVARVAKGSSPNVRDPSFVARFLGEIVDVPFGDEDEGLRAARRSPDLMRSQILEAVTALVATELARQPILLVVEDIHWADVASVRLLGGVLKRLENEPLMILALARPSVDEIHPRLWDDQRAARFVLEPLLRKAAEKLARAVLGDHADIDAIVKRAEGNALFVEELARVCAEGGGLGDLPPTIAAAAEVRLAALPAEARQVLRAGAVLGERFWAGAVARLVGSAIAPRVTMHLDALEQVEVVSREASSRFASEREYAFRHALVRDAAYAMLTEDDRVIGHALAAEWLETRVDDAALLAHHYELGDRREDAARCHVLASEEALAANDGGAVSRHLLRAETCGVSGDLLGRARLAQADLSLWKGDHVAAFSLARDAMSLLHRGSERWFDATGVAVTAAFGETENTQDALAVVDELERTPASDPASGRARAIARARAAIQLVYFGELARTDALLEGCEREPGAAGDAGVLAWICDAAFDRAFASGEPVHPETFIRGRELCERIGDRRGAVTQSGNHVWTLAILGAFDEARAALDRFEREGSELGFRFTKVIGDSVRTIIAVGEGKREWAVDVLLEMRKNLASGRAAGGIAAWRGELLALAGRLDEAAAEVEMALPLTTNAPEYRALALAASAMVKVRRTDLAGALDDSARGMECAAHGVGWIGAYTPYLARFEALHAAGLDDEARAVLRSGAVTLSRRAANLREYGPGYLETGWRTAELMRLAREHGVAPGIG
jgi:eukaryotic-like serine/threonine-protein kinase